MSALTYETTSHPAHMDEPRYFVGLLAFYASVAFLAHLLV